jgi:arabinofuranosyltransferase
MIAHRTYRTTVSALLIGLVAALALVLLPRLPEQVSFRVAAFGPLLAQGETTQIRSFYGFNEIEQDANGTPFRWTDGLGNFMVRDGDRLGGPLVLSLRLCGCREPAPEQVQLRFNNQPLADLSGHMTQPGWRVYHVMLPPRSTAYSPDMLIEVESDTIANPQYGYPMGVAMDSVQLAQISRQRAYSPLMALVLGLLIGVVAWLSTLGRSHSSIRILVAGGIGLMLVGLQGLLYRHQILPAEMLAIGLLVAWSIALQARGALPIVGLLAVGLGALVLAPQILGSWILDDAFISFRYALNAWLGHGFVFNPGERVEGYTNFLWMLLFVPIQALGLDPTLSALAFSLLIALATAALIWQALRPQISDSSAVAALALLVSSTPFVLYAARGSGMETGLFTLLVAAGAVAYIRKAPGALVGLLLALAAMTRPEGVMVAGLCGLHLLASSWLAGRVAWRQVFGLALGFLLIFGPYYAWRYTYYGYPLPNTFYAKVGSTIAQVWRGVGYAREFAAAQAPLVVLAVLGILPIGVASGSTLRQRLSAWAAYPGVFLGMLATAYSTYIILVGGDHFPQFRFFVPVLPLLALLGGLGLNWLSRVVPPLASAPLVTILTVVVLAWQAPQLYDSRTLNGQSGVWTEYTVVEKNREIGLWLREHTEPGTLIGTGIAGALPYYADRPVLDMLGLNDLHIAHIDEPTIGQGVAGSEKTDNDYILRRQPVYIPFNSAGALMNEPRFFELYERGIVHGPEGRWIRLFKLRSHPAPSGWITADIRSDEQ